LVGAGVALPKRIPALKQDPVLRCTCGPAALEAIFRYWFPERAFVVPNEAWTTHDAMVASYAESPRRDLGPSFYWNDPIGLMHAARRVGLNAKTEHSVQVDGIRNQLAEWIARGETILVWRVLDGQSPSEGHFTAIDGIDAVGVHMMDPWPDTPPYQHVPWATFLAQFKNPFAPGGSVIRLARGPLS
jgi:hypothetical protein